jgi:preprotein translocase subunit YajC
MCATLYILLAQGGGAPDPNAPAATGQSLIPLATIGILFVLFYFFMIRGPMKRQEQERQALFSSLKKNDKVVTSGGIIGIVAAIEEKEDEVTLKVDESSNVRLRVLKSSILRNLSREKPAKEQKEGGA